MKSYKLQKLDDDNLIINWKGTGNYIIFILCICLAIFFLGLAIYIEVYYDGIDHVSLLIPFIFLLTMSILLSIIIPKKQQLILNKKEGTIYFKSYNFYGKIFKESLFSYSYVKNIRPRYKKGIGDFIEIILENPIYPYADSSLSPSKCSFCEVIAQKIHLITLTYHKIFPRSINIDTHDDNEGKEIIFIIQDFFKNYDSSKNDNFTPSYKLQKAGNNTLIINWRMNLLYNIMIICIGLLLIYGWVDYIFIFIFTVISIILFCSFSIILPVKLQLILNKNEKTIHYKPYNIYGKIIKISIYNFKENLFSYSSIKNIEVNWSEFFGDFLKINLETNLFVYIPVNSSKEAEKIKFLIQNFFENYDNSSFSQG